MKYLDSNSQIGKNVMVYYNVRLNCWSVLYLGKLLFHTYDIRLNRVTFKVYESGRQTVLKTKVKNVHAYVMGIINKYDTLELNKELEIVYNPYKYSSFVVKNTMESIYSADEVILTDGKVFLVS